MKRKPSKIRSFLFLELLLIAAAVSIFAYFLAKVYLKNLFPVNREDQAPISQQYISPQSITSQSIASQPQPITSQPIAPQYINTGNYEPVISNVQDKVKNMNRQMDDLQKQLKKF